MGREGVDDLDETILYLLQKDARMPMTEIAEKLPVSANTVRNHIRKLEESGVIDGYCVDVDYSETAYPLAYHFNCTASIADRKPLAEEALDIPGVVGVTELMTGHRNLIIRAIGEDQEDITRIAQKLDGLGIEVVDETMVKRDVRRPLAYFDHQDDDTM